jgi:hypothetical protein
MVEVFEEPLLAMSISDRTVGGEALVSLVCARLALPKNSGCPPPGTETKKEEHWTKRRPTTSTSRLIGQLW